MTIIQALEEAVKYGANGKRSDLRWRNFHDILEGMSGEEEVALLRAENKELRALLAQALARIGELEAKVHELESALTKAKSEPPSFAKPNTSKPKDTEKKPRRKRAKDQNGARRREVAPTQTVQHHLEQCPKCHYPLQHPQLALRRQVIELPPPQPVEVTEHQLFKGWCARCQKWHYACLDLSGQVVGQGRMGVRIASLIAYLRTTLRMPLLLIKEYLYSVHNLSISVGEIVELLHRVVQGGPLKQAAAAIKERVRKSKIVHGDETGWREGGQNGYVWGFFTPDGERLYEYDHSRGGAVARRILGPHFTGVVSSDFYGGYNDFPGEHQRCWIHLLRDLHELKEEHKGNEEVDEQVMEWATGVRALYDDAQQLLSEHQLGPPTDEEAERQPYKRQQREAEYRRLVALIREMGERYANAKEHRHHPCHALCKRLLRHQDELFQFVLVSGLSSNNNLAERSIRPVVVSRKVSGGTQSPKGSATRMVLASLFNTWRAKGLNPFDQCLSLLSQPSHP